MGRNLFIVPFALLASTSGYAQEERLQLTIHDHRFTPEELHVPSGQLVTITVRNEDDAAEEFDSPDLGIEKVVAAGREAPVRLRPLAPGRYAFTGEYHAETARGVVIADPEPK